MFDSGNNNSNDNKAIGSRERRPSYEIDAKNYPRGVYGVGVKQNSLEKSSSEDNPDEDDEVSIFDNVQHLMKYPVPGTHPSYSSMKICYLTITLCMFLLIELYKYRDILFAGLWLNVYVQNHSGAHGNHGAKKARGG